MRSLLSISIVFAIQLIAQSLGAQQTGDLPKSDDVKPQLFATGFEFAEGPTFDKAGSLYVVNYRGNGNIGRITADGTASVWTVLSEVAPLEGRKPQANGLKVDKEGRLFVADAGGGRLLRLSADGRRAEILADRFDGERFKSVNDVALDTKGNVYFSDPGGSTVDKPTGSVYRFDISTAAVTKLADNLAFPNGLAVTPDQKHLCVAESAAHRIVIYDLVDGAAANARELIHFPKGNQGVFRGGDFSPDGMIFDSQGRLFVAMWGGGVINVVDIKRGELIRQYQAGGLKATNCHFHMQHLYVTVADKEAVFRLDLGVGGFQYNQQ